MDDKNKYRIMIFNESNLREYFYHNGLLEENFINVLDNVIYSRYVNYLFFTYELMVRYSKNFYSILEEPDEVVEEFKYTKFQILNTISTVKFPLSKIYYANMIDFICGMFNEPFVLSSYFYDSLYLDIKALYANKFNGNDLDVLFEQVATIIDNSYIEINSYIFQYLTNEFTNIEFIYLVPEIANNYLMLFAFDW